MSRSGASSSFFMEQDGQALEDMLPRQGPSYMDDESDESEELEDEMEEEEEEEKEKDDKDYSQMSMEDMLKLQEKVGSKNFNRQVLKVQKVSASKAERRKNSSASEIKRAGRYAPLAMPIMRKRAKPMTLLDQTQKVKKVITRDPRFDDLSGELNISSWQKSYKFLGEMRQKEKKVLLKELSQTKDEEKAEKIQAILKRMNNLERQQSFDEKVREVKREERQKQMDAIRQGLKPKFMTRQNLKQQARAKHYETLKKEHRVDKYMVRQEKRQYAKEMKTFEKEEKEMKTNQKSFKKKWSFK